MSTVLRSGSLMVDTHIFVQLIRDNHQQIEDNRRHTDASLDLMNQFREALQEQSEFLRETRMEVQNLDVRVTALEDAQARQAERNQKFVPPMPIVDSAEPTVVDDSSQPKMLAGGRYQCPRCLKDFSPGYIFKHMANKKNKNCVPVSR